MRRINCMRSEGYMKTTVSFPPLPDSLIPPHGTVRVGITAGYSWARSCSLFIIITLCVWMRNHCVMCCVWTQLIKGWPFKGMSASYDSYMYVSRSICHSPFPYLLFLVCGWGSCITQIEMSGLALGIMLAVQRRDEHVRTLFIINAHFELCWMSRIKMAYNHVTMLSSCILPSSYN